MKLHFGRQKLFWTIFFHRISDKIPYKTNR
jgi:hypothetical protein